MYQIAPSRSATRPCGPTPYGSARLPGCSRNSLNLAAPRVEAPQKALGLACIPDGPVRGDRRVVGTRARRRQFPFRDGGLHGSGDKTARWAAGSWKREGEVVGHDRRLLPRDRRAVEHHQVHEALPLGAALARPERGPVAPVGACKLVERMAGRCTRALPRPSGRTTWLAAGTLQPRTSPAIVNRRVARIRISG